MHVSQKLDWAKPETYVFGLTRLIRQMAGICFDLFILKLLCYISAKGMYGQQNRKQLLAVSQLLHSWSDETLCNEDYYAFPDTS